MGLKWLEHGVNHSPLRLDGYIPPGFCVSSLRDSYLRTWKFFWFLIFIQIYKIYSKRLNLALKDWKSHGSTETSKGCTP